MKQVVIDITWVVFGVLLLALLLHTKITWKPFSISFENWRFVLGIFIIFVGVEILCYDAVNKFKTKLFEDIKKYEAASNNISGEPAREEDRQD